MLHPDQFQLDLRQFTGTTQRHRWSSLTKLVCTDGAKYLADEAGAYWLLDAVASHQNAPVIQDSQRLQEFQIWTLTVEADRSGRLTCAEDSDVALRPSSRRTLSLLTFRSKKSSSMSVATLFCCPQSTKPLSFWAVPNLPRRHIFIGGFLRCTSITSLPRLN